jgi:1,4-alpha-glucan branching enzyme
MLYRDYSRKARRMGAQHPWRPREPGGGRPSCAELNATVAERFPRRITIAEESTAWPGVTAPVDHGGLGFPTSGTWAGCTTPCATCARDPVHRAGITTMTFGLVYAFSERFMLPLSHDEVVHGKGSLLSQDARRPLAAIRQPARLPRLMWAHPGKKLLFMGGEFGQRREWNHDANWTGTCSTTRSTAACSAWCATSTASTRTEARAAHGSTPPARLLLGSPTTQRQQRLRLRAALVPPDGRPPVLVAAT